MIVTEMEEMDEIVEEIGKKEQGQRAEELIKVDCPKDELQRKEENHESILP